MEDIIRALNQYVLTNTARQHQIKDDKEKSTLGFLNTIAKDFITIVKETGYDEKALQDAIKAGLNRIDASGIYFDSEEEEEICIRIENLMDVVGLASSGGYLNIWRYGFDPS